MNNKTTQVPGFVLKGEIVENKSMLILLSLGRHNHSSLKVSKFHGDISKELAESHPPELSRKLFTGRYLIRGSLTKLLEEHLRGSSGVAAC